MMPRHGPIPPRIRRITHIMTSIRPKFSICIPAYNRARHLPQLLDSIFAQDFSDFNIVICEDCSAERTEIDEIVSGYSQAHPGVIAYHENEKNLGYDGNIRKLVEKASGEFCFFMGNDDFMCSGALSAAADVIARHPDVGFVLKSYAFSDRSAGHVRQEVRYFSGERCFAKGREAILVCYRRSGVMAGYIIRRDPAFAAATDKYDGTLFYQMHLTARVLADWPAVFTPAVLVVCGGDETPDFGNSAKEKGKYLPGGYTAQARLNMIQGVLTIIRDFSKDTGLDVAGDVQRDYANYFYPYIKDQLRLPLKSFFSLYRAYSRMGFGKYPIFHVYCLAAYVLGERKFDLATKEIRQRLGHTPRLGMIGK
jgi:abequosyltransferase